MDRAIPAEVEKTVDMTGATQAAAAAAPAQRTVSPNITAPGPVTIGTQTPGAAAKTPGAGTPAPGISMPDPDTITPESGTFSDLMAGLSHDLRVSMNAIHGYVLLLLKNAEDPGRVKEYARKIGLSCQELLMLVDQAEDLSMPSSEEEEKEEEFAMADLLMEVDRVIRPLAESRGLHFSMQTIGLEHDIFFGNRAIISRILINLLSGGARHTMGNGQIFLRVQGDNDPQESFLTFEIQDSGEGFSPEVLKRLLGTAEAESSAERTADRASTMPGMRVSLTATRRLVERVGGTISVQSGVREGTTFIVSLRLRKVNEGKDNFWTRRGVKRVLCAGRSREEGIKIGALLTEAGVQADLAFTGGCMEEMIRTAISKDESYDLLLIDEQLSDMSGTEALARISEIRGMNRKDTTVLMLNTVGEEPAEEDRQGADALMPKPFYLSMLRGILEELRPVAPTVGTGGLDDLSGDGTGDGADYDAQGNENPFQGLRFLVAEDNALNADIAKELLELEGARCEIAGNGMAAVAMFRNSRPAYYDMILMDIQMPVMDGFKATSTIRSLPREDAASLPIIAMTGSIFTEDVKRAFDSGMNAHVAKPIDIGRLRNTVRKLKKK